MTGMKSEQELCGCKELIHTHYAMMIGCELIACGHPANSEGNGITHCINLQLKGNYIIYRIVFVYLQKTPSRETDNGCSTCGKYFSSKGNLLLHQRSVHFGIYPYTCETCGKGYTNKDNLRSHIFLHTGEMAYECSVCSEKFRCKPHLDKHKKIHSWWKV